MNRRIISVIAVFSMLFSLFPTQYITASAALPDKGKVEMVYLKQLEEDPKSTEYYPDGGRLEELSDGEGLNSVIIQENGTVGRTDGLQAGDSFWVGLKISNLQVLKNYEQTEDYKGLINISIGLVYDSQYLYEPYMSTYQTGRPAKPVELPLTENYSFVPGLSQGESTAYLTSILPYMNDIPDDYSYSIDPANTAGDVYTINNGSSKDKEISIGYEIPGAESTSKEIFVNYVKADQFNAADMFTADEAVIAVMRFKVKEVPPAGTQVFAFDNAPTTLAMGFTTNQSSAEANVQIQNNATDTEANDYQYYMELPTIVNPFPEKHLVTYDATDGTFAPNAETTEPVAEGSHPTLNNSEGNPISDSLIAPDGKVFGGWYTDQVTQDESTAFTTASVVTEPITVYAKWEDGYKVTFHANAADATLNAEGLTEKAYTVKNGEALLGVDETIADTLGLVPTRENYIFDGWYQKNGNTFTEEVTDAKLQEVLSGSMDVYAKWKYDEEQVTPTYTLNFDNNADDATEANPTSVKYNANDTLNTVLGGMPVEPIRDGYEFLGWYKNQSGDGAKLTSNDVLETYTESGTVDTVYAKWGYADIDDSETDDPTPKDDTVTVKFNLDGGQYTYGTVNDKYVKYGGTIGENNMPLVSDLTPPSENKAFGGWYTQQNGAGNELTGTTVIDNSFDVSLDGTGQDEITVYANWIDQVTLTYDANGLPAEAYTALPTQEPVTPGTEVTIQNLEINGGQTYEFKGWNTEKNGSGTMYQADERLALNENETLYAIWDYTGDDKVAVTFNVNDTTQFPATLNPNNGDPDTKQYTMYRKPNTVIAFEQAPTATRNEYTFAGWAEASNSITTTFDGTANTSYTVPEGGSILYAVWTANPTVPTDKITINFDKNNSDAGSTEPSPTSVTIDLNDSLGGRMPNEPTRTGYRFDGWYTNADSTLGTKVESTTVFDTILLNNQNNITLYAKWTGEVKVEFDLNGAGGTKPETIVGYPGEEKQIPTPALGQDEKFVEWNTMPNGTGDKVNVGAYNLTDTDLKLYAIWNYDGADKVAITFDANDTTQFPATLTPNDGTNPKQYTMYRKPGAEITFAQMPTAARAEYTFNKWDEKSNAAVEPAFDNSSYTYTVQDAATLYAIWESNPTTVTDKITINFDLNDLPADDAVITSPESVVIDLNDSLGGRMADEPTREGYDFMGWNTLQNGGGTDVTSTTVFGPDKDVAANAGETVTLYAQWVQHVTVTFDPNGGDPVAPSTMELSKGTNITEALPTATKTDYVFKGWNTAPNGSGIWFTEDNKGDEDHKINEDTTLYAIWSYEKADAISIVFHVNDTTQKPGIISPADVDNAKQYTIKVKPGDSLAFNNMPTATRTEYVFNRWGEKANDVVKDSFDNSTYTIEAPASGPATVDRYAIWKANPGDATTDWTVSFVLNGATTTVPESIADILVADGDVIGPAMPDDPTQEGYKFLGWMDVTDGDTGFDESSKFDADTVEIIRNTTLKAFWNQELQITFNVNGGKLTDDSTNNSLNPITVLKGESVSQRTEDPKTLPVVEKENFEFDGWYYEDEHGALVKVTDATPIEKSVELTAKWTGLVKVEFTTIEFTYNGQEQTPLTDGNITVTQLNPETLDPVGIALEGYTANMFTATYTDDEDTPVDGVPVDAGTYNINVTLTTQKDTADKFTEFEVLTVSPTQYTILQKPVDYTIGNNYQYLADIGDKEKITVELTDPDTDPAPTIDDILNGTAGKDLTITFTKQDGTKEVISNTMPTAFGKYKIEVTATADSNFSVGTLSEKDKAGASAEIYLYLIPTTRVVKANYGDGTVFGGSDHEVDYTTVTITPPANPSDIASAKTTLATGGAKKVLPIEGTDFTPPTGKTIDKWVTKTTGADGEVQTDFTVDTYILYGTEPLIIYAVYKDAQWNVTFRDTKADSPATDVVYTVEATKAISESGAVKLVDGQAPEEAVTDVPTIETAPENKMFFGWATEDLSVKGDLKVSDVTDGGTYADKIFTKDTLPADVLPEDSVDITVYAVYVLSDDATLKDAAFKETDENGNAVDYTDENYEVTEPVITFDPETDKYYMAVGNDIENVFANLIPNQPGATIEVTVNTVPVSTEDGTDGKTFTSAVTETVYDAENDTNSTNTVVVTVTAPDGTTQKTYTFEVLRYAEARFVLNYGNSPVGVIMSNDEKYQTPTEKEEAIAEFQATRIFNDITSGLNYYEEAWSSYGEYNGDDDPTAMFIFQREDFRDVGFTAYDSMGKEVDDSTVTVSTKITTYAGGVAMYNEDDKAVDVEETGSGNNYLFTKFSTYNLRPDVYKINYTFEDSYTGTTVEATRNLIVVSDVGDVFINSANVINSIDSTNILSNLQHFAEKTTSSVYRYRVADTVVSSAKVINSIDSTNILSNLSGGLPVFYNRLQNN